MKFEDLPAEVLIHILGLLDVPDLVNSRRLNSTIDNLFISSSYLQYVVALHSCGMRDEPSFPLDYRSKLSLLKAHNSAWLQADTTIRKTPIKVKVPHMPSSIYDLSDGTFLLGDAQGENNRFTRTRALRHVSLKESGKWDDSRQGKLWSCLDLGTDLVDIGLAIYEHDLVAAITREANCSDHEDIKLHFVQFSTGEPHPLALSPILPVAVSLPEWHRVTVQIEITGSLILLLLTWPLTDRKSDVLMLIDWMRGEVLSRQENDSATWGGLVFLSPTVAAIPNLQANVLEIVDLSLPSCTSTLTADPLPRIALLGLPTHRANHVVATIQCRSDPNPTGTGLPANSTVRGPFSDDPAEAIIVFDMFIQDWFGLLGGGCQYTFIVHRRALLDLAYTQLSKRGPAPALHMSPKDPKESGAFVPWADWGPAHTRWHNLEDDIVRWITTSSGQRRALVHKDMLYINDYNQDNVRRVLTLQNAAREEKMSPYKPHLKVITEPNTIEHPDLFKEAVTSALPYVQIQIPLTHEYEGILLDSQRLIGLHTSDTHAVDRIDIFPISPAN